MYKPNDKVMVYCTIERIVQDSKGISYVVRADCQNNLLRTMEVPTECVTSSNEILGEMEGYDSRVDR